jgi:hypothetical protein
VTQLLLTTVEEFNALKLEYVPEEVRDPPRDVDEALASVPAVRLALERMLQGTGVGVDEVAQAASLIAAQAVLSLVAQGANEETLHVADTVATTLWIDGLATGLRHARANAERRGNEDEHVR